MPSFSYVAINASGNKEKGQVEAKTKEQVIDMLKSRRLEPKSVNKDLEINIPGITDKIDTKTIVVFTRTFSTMIDAGLPLVQCLDLLANQQEVIAFRRVLMQIKGDVEGGSTFAEALGKHPKVFDDLYVNLVAAGEVGGILDNILSRLAAYMEKAEKLKKKVKGALMYPFITIFVAVVVVYVLLVFVIPVFQKMFADFGGELPALTQMVINISEGMQAHGPYVVGALVVTVVVLGQFRSRTAIGTRIFDQIALSAPLFGPLIKKTAVARFTRTMGTMLSSGVPIMDGLEITAKTAGNVLIAGEIMRCRSAIEEGRTMTEPLQGSKIFPSMVVQMIEVGEQTGAMDAMLVKIADFYDEEVEAAVDTLTAAIEPIMMVVLGGILGTLIIAMYLPIFSLAGAIH